ncbi:MAG: Fructokinase [Candidatus Celerinatantimonas neptuna]|nr:MAG: Fructokinase [Candidatus Celerinatantimonas neptuna]
MNKKVQVWCLGDVVVDLLPDGELRYRQCPGGAPANVAVALSRLGVTTGFIGCRGDDPFGKFMNDTLVKEGIITDYLHVDSEYHTSTVLVSLDDEGERYFTFLVVPSADQFLHTEQLPDIQTGQWLQLSSIALAGEQTRQAALAAVQQTRNNGGYVFFDVNVRESLWTSKEQMIAQISLILESSDVVKVSEEEAQLLTGQSNPKHALAQLAKQTDALLVVTLGADGAIAFDQSKQISIPLENCVSVVDSTGAGDGFVGGMLSVLAEHSQWRDWSVIEMAIRLGNQVGSFVVTQKGAMSALPRKTQL